MMKRTAIITGAYGKIGKAIATKIAVDNHYKVVLVGRNKSALSSTSDELKKLTHNSDISFREVDLSRKSSIQDFAKSWSEPLHILVNNAATTPRQRIVTPEGIEMQFATNVLGYMWMMDYFSNFMPVKEDTRIVNVASYWAGDLDISDLEFQHRRYNNNIAYRQTKQADRMLTMVYSELLLNKRISVVACHPGDVNSKLSNNLGFGGHESPEQGAHTPAWLAISKEVAGVTGRYFENRSAKSCHLSADRDLNYQLYELCKKY